MEVGLSFASARNFQGKVKERYYICSKTYTMNYISKTSIVIILMVLNLSFAFCQKTIEILASDLPTGNLTLSDSGYSEVTRGETIVWSIKDPNVDSFRITKKHWYVHNIFVNAPRERHARNINLHVEPNAWFNWNYKYSIIWKDKQHNEHTYDPKIAIMPPGGITDFILNLGLIISLLTSIVFYYKWRKAVVELKSLRSQSHKNLQ